MSRLREDDRGQLVLVAAAVLALALIPLAFAYLQLGYHADVEAATADRDAGTETVRLLERAVHEAAGEATGHPWSGRNGAIRAINDSLTDDVDGIQSARVGDGVASEVRQNDTVATRWATANCPGGIGQSFGSCETHGGLVVQERAGETTLVAVAFDVHVVGPNSETDLTVVIRAVGGRASA